jgi:hypothetical protein
MRPPNKKGPIPEKSYCKIGEQELHCIQRVITNLGLESKQGQAKEYPKCDQPELEYEYRING